MLSDNRFVKDSLELNLFFLRIMKEHMVFIAASLTPRDSNYRLFADKVKSRLEDLLKRSIRISNGIISNEVKTSGELVTNYTLSAEKKTEFYTGAHINTDITEQEIKLIKGDFPKVNVTPYIDKEINAINNSIIALLKEIILFKKKLKDDVLSCKMFTTAYPTMINHLLEEATLYLSIIERIQRKEQVNIAKEVLSQENFWNHIMEEHSEFIRGMLDPSEDKLIEIAEKFHEKFKSLVNKGSNIHENLKALEELTRESLEATKNIVNFKKQGTEGILSCKIKSIILPLLSDHVLREANHYVRLLNSFNKSL
ncbi:DUF2935 domain-containing protein [Clostridium cylindrosporum]|uniref:DUF2935 domain-containing protein n=1 Tax=Clostridium cylindrosporum DSM 605 TaxID=1121307 RepID=A0A0J8G1H8_CLOCY|nr:DUF2935 domain-containing protein [Clostridium cylindrosporum]KMT21616.1 hypothetical protein CLCY_2c03780 [Clostridium cylindrosporum DSM 605]